MNTSEQAKKGFKTFLITLSVSLVLFSFVYYVVTDSRDEFNIDDASSVSAITNTNTNSPEVAGTTDAKQDDTKVTVGSSNPESLFGEINKMKDSPKQRTVLAGATQTSQSSVPETGVDSITYALIGSSLLLGIGVFIYMYGPRKIAIRSFEKEVIRSLDKDL